jgi:hypothetical protein
MGRGVSYSSCWRHLPSAPSILDGHLDRVSFELSFVSSGSSSGLTLTEGVDRRDGGKVFCSEASVVQFELTVGR